MLPVLVEDPRGGDPIPHTALVFPAVRSVVVGRVVRVLNHRDPAVDDQSALPVSVPLRWDALRDPYTCVVSLSLGPQLQVVQQLLGQRRRQLSRAGWQLGGAPAQL